MPDFEEKNGKDSDSNEDMDIDVSQKSLSYNEHNFNKDRFNSELQAILKQNKWTLKQYAKATNISTRHLFNLRRGFYLYKGEKKVLSYNQRVVESVNKEYVKALPVYYIAYIYTIQGEMGDYYMVKVEKVRGFDGAVQLLEIAKARYGLRFLDYELSDRKTEIGEKLYSWLAQYDNHLISNIKQVEIWLRMYWRG